jgi:hypothetical protein
MKAGYGLDSWALVPGRSKRLFLPHRDQTGPGTHQASYPMDTRVCVFEGKAVLARKLTSLNLRPTL